eukprot:Skav214752  [mRNA]  locus=scaffold983:202851:205260:- [translate_table: standard]
MPGKWVGGAGSLACPTKGQYIEAKVNDDEGKAQGTVFLEVKRLFGTGSTGRSILCNLVTASDKYYRYWASTKAGLPTTVDGNYHLCRGDPARCDGGSGELTVHLGKWRTWDGIELLSEATDFLDKEAKESLLLYLKKETLRDAGAKKGGLPWGAGALRLGGDPTTPKKGDKKEKEAPGKEPEDDPRRKAARDEKATHLKKQLEDLKRQLEECEEEEAASGARKAKKKKTGEREEVKKKARKDKSGDRKKKDPSGEPSDEEDEDDEEESSDDSSEEEDDPEDKKEEARKTKEKEKALAEKAKRSKKKKKKDPDAKEAGKKKRKKGKKTKEKKKEKKKDHGPFGVAPTEEWTKDDKKDKKKSSDDEDSETTDGSETSFHKAPSATSHHLKLVRYAKRNPGRLAARLLRKMKQATGCAGGAETNSLLEKDELHPVAHMYFLAVMTPGLRDKWSQRTQRELKIATTILDLLVLGKGQEAADVIAQRIKALEKSAQDGNQWRKAKFLELIEADDAVLIDRGEEAMMTKEAEREEKNRGGRTWWPDGSLPPPEPAVGPRIRPPDGRQRPPEPVEGPRGRENEEEVDEAEVGEVPQEAMAEESTRKPGELTRETFEKEIRELLRRGKLHINEVGMEIMSMVQQLPTKFGRFRHKLEEAALDKVKASGPAAPDILPISVAAVEEELGLKDEYIRKWAAYSCLCLLVLHGLGKGRPLGTLTGADSAAKGLRIPASTACPGATGWTEPPYPSVGGARTPAVFEGA